MHKAPAVERASFSGHESFPLRYAWLKKGYDGIISRPGFFSDEDAMTELGVGKNMVRSIRHWGIACGLWEPQADTRGRDLMPTPLGRSLLSDQGWDPYLDEPGTIWLLHWNLARSPEQTTTFWHLFSRQKPGPFTKDELLLELGALAEAVPGGRKPPASTLQRDLDVVIRCYTRARSDEAEDAINSPLQSLGLLRPVEGQRGTFVAPLSSHPSLPQGIFEAALLDLCSRRGRGDQALPLDELLYGWGSPGRVFRLSEGALMDRLQAASDRYNSLILDETAGLRQLVVKADHPDPLAALEQHYGKPPAREAA